MKRRVKNPEQRSSTAAPIMMGPRTERVRRHKMSFLNRKEVSEGFKFQNVSESYKSREGPPAVSETSGVSRKKKRKRKAAALATCFTRGEVACMLFADLTPKEAGIRVAHDIVSTPLLYREMRKLGYRRNEVGYTPEQIKVLEKFYKTKIL